MDRYENWNRRRERAMREGRDEGDWRDEDRGQTQGDRHRDHGEPQYGAYGQSSRWSPPWSESRFSGRRFGGMDEGRGGDYYGDRPQYEGYDRESRSRDMPPEWSRDRWERGMEERRGSMRGMQGRGREASMGGRYDQDRSRWELDQGRSEGGEQWSPYRGGGERGVGMGANAQGGMGNMGQQRGPYRGRGPKDYVRSDQRIREDVCDILTEDDNVDATDISVKVEKGEVTLEGSVTSRHAKHMAENLADACSGVKDVHNHLRVRRTEREEEEGGERTNGRQYYQGASGQQTSR